MLALETGWTPDVIAELPRRFRLAAHWALFARAIVGPEGLPVLHAPAFGASGEAFAQHAAASAAVSGARLVLYPKGD